MLRSLEYPDDKVSDPQKIKRANEFQSVELSEREYYSCRLYQEVGVRAKRTTNASIKYRQYEFPSLPNLVS
jgi:hypothetical protein